MVYIVFAFYYFDRNRVVKRVFSKEKDAKAYCKEKNKETWEVHYEYEAHKDIKCTLDKNSRTDRTERLFILE